MTRRMKRQRSHRAAPAGFTLMEMMAFIGLFSVILLALSQLFIFNTETAAEAQRAQADLARWDAALRQLRADVWNASVIACPDPRSTVLGAPSQPTITWRFDAEQQKLSRATSPADDGGETAGAPQWRIPFDVTFVSDGPSLLLEAGDSQLTPEDRVRLVSQRLLAVRQAPAKEPT